MYFQDQINRTITLSQTPKRIVSLVPSQTEYLHALGLEEEVIGITKFCIHPEHWFRNKKRIGGTKNVAVNLVKSLEPDLIIGNKEENSQSDIDELSKIAPVWMSDIFNLEDSLEMMLRVGELVGKKEKSIQICNQIQVEFQQLIPFHRPKTALYLIWKNPYMAAAKNTFVDAMLKKIGLKNFLENEERYPTWNPENSETPDFIFLSSEPFPFAEKDTAELQLKFPNTQVVLVDGEYFSWYGSRLLGAPAYFNELLKTLV